MNSKPAADSVAEAVRLSHCAHPFADTHKCVGQCTITPKGVLLVCPECGDGGSDISDTPGYSTLRELLKLIGIQVRYLDPDTIKDMLTILKRSQ